jgi:hypothetical protein
MFNKRRGGAPRKKALKGITPHVLSYKSGQGDGSEPSAAPILSAANRCPFHRDYHAKRAPVPDKGEDRACEACWSVYNAWHDLPSGSRLSKSKVSNLMRLTRRLPYVESGFTVAAAPYRGAIEDVLLPLQILSRDGLVVTSLAIDPSLTSTGVALLGYLPTPYHAQGKRWIALTFKVGYALKADEADEVRLRRQLAIATAIVRVLKVIQLRNPSDKPLQISMEDHIYDSHGMRAHDMYELHGIIKSQIFLTLKTCPVRVNVKAAPVLIHHHGDCRKESARRSFVAAGWSWVERISEDEVDALTIALVHLVNTSPLGLSEILATDMIYDQAIRSGGRGDE